MPPLQRFVVALTGGLQDSKAQPDPGDFVRLYNFSTFRGRFGIRAPVEQIQTIGSESSILDIKRHLDKVFILTWNSTNEDVDLYSMPFISPTGDWGTETLETQVYAGVTTRPDIKLTSFSGGSETTPQDRLYIADFTQSEPTKYWVDYGAGALHQLKEDLDASGSAEDVYFSLMAPYQFHLWGTGFYGGTGTNYRPEMLRFSQPGLIPNIDPAGGVDKDGGTPASKEWFSFSYRNLGRRGDRIQALSYAAGNMMVFQAGSIHALFGYGQDSWAAKQVSDQIGCVGPNAVVQAGSGGLCYFWSHDGPFATDGSTLQPMGEDIRQHVVDLGADDKVSAAYAPDEGIIYYSLYSPGTDVDAAGIWPSEYLAFDVNRNKWADGSWLDGGESDPFRLQISCLETLTPREISAAPGPIGAPTTLALVGFDQTFTNTTVNLSWVPGDTSTEVETVIHRSLTPAFSAGSGNEIGRQPSGDAASYSDTGRDGLTDYYYQVRHFRNGSYSAISNELAVTTPCPTLTDYVLCKTIPTGVKVTVEVPAGAVDVLIERRIFESAGSAGWTEATTLSNPGSGTRTYDDTDGECYQRYHYRGTCQKAAETDSEVVEMCPSYRQSCRPVGACVEGSALAFEVSAGTLVMYVPEGKRYTRVDAACTYLHASVGYDMLESAVDKGDGEGYVEIQTHALATADGAYWRTWFANCPQDDSTWTIRWRSLHGGTHVLNTDTHTPSNPCSGVDI